MPAIDTMQHTTTTPTLAIPRWHEKGIVTLVFGGLGLIGLTVLVVAILLVSQDSTRPSGRPVVVSVTPTSKPAATLPQSTIIVPSPVVSSAPAETPPPPTAEAPAPETAAAQLPAAQPPPSNWPRWRRWLWALQHPHGPQ